MIKLGVKSLQRRKGKKWIILYIIYTINFLIFLFYIVLLEPYWGDINFTVSGWINSDINIVLIIALIIIIPLGYGVILLSFKLKKIIKHNEIKPCLINKIAPIVLLILYNFLIILLLELLEDYANVIFQKIEYYSFFIFFGLDITLIALLYPVLKIFRQLKNRILKRHLSSDRKGLTILICTIGVYILVFSLPLVLIPSNVLYYNLPPEPKLIAHRGASHLAPENTIKAGEAALEYDLVEGWEVDIQISYDGVPFLMHDDTLTRTTNVSEHFPSRKDDYAYNFNISELRELDAGSWFVNKDPFGVIANGIVPKAKAETFRGIKIPTFEEVLNFTKDNNYILDFDAYRPPVSHPYHEDFYEILINMTINSGINLRKVMIPTQNSEWINLINNLAPEILLGWGGSPKLEEYQSSLINYSYINTGDGYSNEEYRILNEANINVMVWTIEAVERFYQLWCLGVDWVKTNSPYKFNNLDSTFLHFPIGSYTTIWVALGITALCSIRIIKTELIEKKKILKNK